MVTQRDRIVSVLARYVPNDQDLAELEAALEQCEQRSDGSADERVWNACVAGLRGLNALARAGAMLELEPLGPQITGEDRGPSPGSDASAEPTSRRDGSDASAEPTSRRDGSDASAEPTSRRDSNANAKDAVDFGLML